MVSWVPSPSIIKKTDCYCCGGLIDVENLMKGNGRKMREESEFEVLTERPEKNDFSKLFCVNDSIFRLFYFEPDKLNSETVDYYYIFFMICHLLFFFFLTLIRCLNRTVKNTGILK